MHHQHRDWEIFLREKVALIDLRNHLNELVCATISACVAIFVMSKLSAIWGDIVAVVINLNEINPRQMIPFCNRLQ
jgi:hypothetical protein